MSSVASAGRFGLLLRLKGRSLLNRFHQAAAESPIKLVAMAGFIALIWAGLYVLFARLFDSLRATPLEAIIAIPQLFNLFFAAVLILLTFSNAVLAYGALFTRGEAAYLLASPLPPRSVVAIKFFETLVLSSASLVLLGLPLMAALAGTARDPSLFYALFPAFFLCFIPIPAALGMLGAWAVARFFPRARRRGVAFAALAGLALCIGPVLRSMADQAEAEQRWLREFLVRMDFLETALLPSTWVTRGIEHALRHEASAALGYLAVTLANALLLARLVIALVAARLMPAYDRAGASRAEASRSAARAAGGAAGAVFFYLPRRLRLIAAKDLRTFMRDPLQWSQLAILFGLMALYLLNVPRFHIRVSESNWGLLIPFLNLSAVSFMLATFTSRFVFPMPSLEGRQLWLIGLLPLSMRGVLLAKFAFAMTVTLLVGGGSVALSVVTLDIPTGWAVIHLAVVCATCAGLCGLSVGIGARLPVLDQTNPARIANSLGGTINLIASVGLVVLVLLGVGLISLRAHRLASVPQVDSLATALGAVLILLSVGVGLAALHVGARHLARIEA